MPVPSVAVTRITPCGPTSASDEDLGAAGEREKGGERPRMPGDELIDRHPGADPLMVTVVLAHHHRATDEAGLQPIEGEGRAAEGVAVDQGEGHLSGVGDAVDCVGEVALK